MGVEFFNGMALALPAWPAAGGTQIQIGLWGLILLSLLYGLWEVARARKTPTFGPARLVSLPGGLLPPGEQRALNGEALTVGRGPEAALRLPGQSVAMRHASVVPEGGAYWIKDLGSHSGVRLNGRPLEQAVSLRDGDVFSVGDQSFRFQQERRAPWEPNVWTGMLLLCAGALFVLTQLAAWGASGPGRPPSDSLLAWSTGLALAAMVSTVLLRRRRLVVDPVLLPAAMALLAVGLTVILRVRPELYLRQVQAAALGLGVLTLGAMLPLKVLGRYRYLSLVAGILLLLITLILGRVVGDQRLALNLWGFQFQPAEPAKLLLAVFLAGLVSERQELLARSGRGWTMSRSDVRYVGPMLLALGLALGLLVVQRDFGTALLFFGLFVAFLGMASGRVVFVLVSLAAFAFGAVLSAAAFDRVRERVDLWINPWQDPKGLGYQLSQSLFALAAGGFEGVGLGKGFPGLVPAAHTDLPLAVIGEELGLVGGLAVLTLLAILVFRGYHTALRADDDFLGLLAAGLTTVLALQGAVIVGGLVRLLPLTGVTLPFVSFGGTSLVVNFALVGILMGVSAAAKRPAHDRPRVARRFSWKRQLGWVMGVVALAFVGLGGMLGFWQTVRATDLTRSPHNPRLRLIEPDLHRGKIVGSRGEVLAESVLKEGVYRRLNRQGGLLAGILGYRSERHGATGVEGEADYFLLGRRHFDTVAGGIERAESRRPGDNARLTIDLPLQREAAAALGSRRGSVVAIEPSTGAVKAIVSSPRYALPRVDDNWEKLTTDPRRPLLFPATAGVYPPGSTFKVVTALVALQENALTPETAFSCGGWGSVGNYAWHCFDGEAHGRLTFADALRVSCNVTFGRVGRKLGRDRLVAGARRLGIGVAPPFGEAAAGMIDPQNEPWASVPVQIGFGQGPLAVTPLQMALVAAAVANDGVLMKPYVIDRYETPQKQPLQQTKPEIWQRAVKPGAARAVRKMMTEAVHAGTGGRAALAGLEVAGKTGTAENPHGEDHAWFISFAPARKPTLALAILVEGGGQGGRVAAPIARRLYAQYFGVPQPED